MVMRMLYICKDNTVPGNNQNIDEIVKCQDQKINLGTINTRHIIIIILIHYHHHLARTLDRGAEKRELQ